MRKFFAALLASVALGLAGGAGDRLRRALQHVVGADDLDLHLGQEIHDVFGAAVELGVALLAAEALDLGDGDALHPDGRQRFAHFVELEGFDDGGDEFHDACSGSGGALGHRLGKVQKVLETDTSSVSAPAATTLPVEALVKEYQSPALSRALVPR